MSLPLSVLDLAPVVSGTSAAESVRRTVDLAQLAERLGYVRYWFAEHHSLPSVASSSPEVLIAHVAAHTERIRVGSGGIMLPNHVPLRIAEAFHTLAALHPGRIDLGIGRAPGSEPIASQALRAFDGNAFSSLMSELMQLSRGLYEPGHPFHTLTVMPPDVERPPMFLLGSSGASATSAGRAGLGYAFASHFSATDPAPAIATYRENFQPGEAFAKPHAILGVAAVCAETDEAAQRLATTMELAWLRIEQGEFLPLPSPEEADAYAFTAGERASIQRRRQLTVTGRPKTVREEIERRVVAAGADEAMVVTNIWSHEARLRSYELLAAA
ncbi:LLM class flavin-dependent oxidoreductase [Sporichthya sp.]|uniref:LLM class flavin-dependent oxidoreductase n=1 Tax=Sporichthya sp. TaxID=65475 RepID=UPI0017DC0A5C|nr:LLM class flavin-dependent oxidoreductase [Sporichthya sp.]MBA3741862.1 LLM class flavin-dependent oxidoreductase [Sporichthya sp.]